MSEQRNPICPSCGYDLNGIVAPGAIADCPECGRTVSYLRALEPPKSPHTIRHTLIALLAVPSALAVFFWWSLYQPGDQLSIAVPVWFLSMASAPYLLIYAAVLLVREKRFRNRTTAFHHTIPFVGIVVIVIIACSISATLWWLNLSDWVETVANV